VLDSSRKRDYLHIFQRSGGNCTFSPSPSTAPAGARWTATRFSWIPHHRRSYEWGRARVNFDLTFTTGAVTFSTVSDGYLDIEQNVFSRNNRPLSVSVSASPIGRTLKCTASSRHWRLTKLGEGDAHLLGGLAQRIHRRHDRTRREAAFEPSPGVRRFEAGWWGGTTL